MYFLCIFVYFFVVVFFVFVFVFSCIFIVFFYCIIMTLKKKKKKKKQNGEAIASTSCALSFTGGMEYSSVERSLDEPNTTGSTAFKAS